MKLLFQKKERKEKERRKEEKEGRKETTPHKF
jgi:hypothetical protein